MSQRVKQFHTLYSKSRQGTTLRPYMPPAGSHSHITYRSNQPCARPSDLRRIKRRPIPGMGSARTVLDLEDRRSRKSRGLEEYTGWPKKSKPPPIFQKIVLKIANEIRFFRKVKV